MMWGREIGVATQVEVCFFGMKIVLLHAAIFFLMKNPLYLNRFLILLSITLCFSACQNNEAVDPLGPEFVVDNASFKNYSTDWNYQNTDSIPADSYKIAVNLQSSNPYAATYGINPVQQNRIVDIEILTLLDFNDYAAAGDKINDLFLVQKGNSYDELYQTIPVFLQEEEGYFEGIDKGKLVFTNQTGVGTLYDELIINEDVIPCEFKVKMTFDNALVIEDTLRVTLFAR